jgi:hypothetical protein
VRLVVDLDDLDLHGLADGHHLGRMVHAPPCHVGDVQQAVDAAEITNAPYSVMFLTTPSMT